MTNPVTNSGTERNLPTFEEACRKSSAPDLIRLVLAVADVVQRLNARWMRDPASIPSRAQDAAFTHPDTPVRLG